MSNALTRAAYQARVDSGPAKSVLVRLCDLANDDGTSVFPSVPRIAADCDLGERTVQDALRRLESLRVLVLVKEANVAKHEAREYRIDPAVLAALPRSKDRKKDQRHAEAAPPRCGHTPLVQEPHHPGAGAAPARCSTRTSPGAGAAPSTTIIPTIGENLSLELGDGAAPASSEPRHVRPDVDALFEQFWAAVPLRKSKGAALRAYRTALKLASADDLMAGIRRYAAEVAGREPRFIKHPATWLNGRCWLDEPAPAHGDRNEQHHQASGTAPRGAWAVAAERHAEERAGSAGDLLHD